MSVESDPIKSPQRILMFGGTFDPPHLAHAVLPAQAAVQLNCDVLLYVPAAINPLKANHPTAPDEERVAMLLLATADVPNAKISTIEVDRPGPSYTIDTLRALHVEYAPSVETARQPSAVAASQAARQHAPHGAVTSRATAADPEPLPEFYLLIGCDQALEFHRWKDWQQILTLATPAVMLRPPWNEELYEAALRAKYSKVEAESWMSWTLRLPRMDVNATEIRKRLCAGDDDSLREWLDPAVLDYIRANNLYSA